ncbi:MAG TPA: MarR family transcriptional regulator [Terriglobales bacterium]|nr:MarR family transcriptional regulator [Terriglobales bacterium]
MAGLSPAKQRLILHWGEMGDRWGVNRTVAQVHALLHLSPVPLTAEEIAETLSVARSNVSTSIRELQSWGLVRPVQTLGERRQQFESVKDVWEMFRIILDQRKKREIDPTLQVLRECISGVEGKDGDSVYARERLRELEDFFSGVDTIYSELRQLPPSALRRFLKARGLIRKLMPAK